MSEAALASRDFFARDALEVALDLPGMLVALGPVVLRLTEVEAYRWPNDSANHCRAGRTRRNAPMWGPPGHAYVYRCYGLHWMLNLVTGAEGEGAAVLVRAAELVAGEALVLERRGRARGPALLAGPGRVAAALRVDGTFSGHDICTPGGLEVRVGSGVGALLAGPRVGIDYADPADVAAPWRIAAADTRWVSRRASLRPIADWSELDALRERSARGSDGRG
jgi:DNA-3-methyladenine glycosylase